MKHLSALQEGKLVIVRREGKYRFNYLNVIPLEVMNERWVGKYTKKDARSLLNIKSLAEQTGGELEMEHSKQAKVFRIEK